MPDNLYLSVVGRRADVQRFRKAAGESPRHFNAKKSEMFRPYFQQGAGGSHTLTADGVEPFQKRFQRATYSLQSWAVDFANFIREVSKAFSQLAFVETWSAEDDSMCGGYLAVNGRLRRWSIPERVRSRVITRHYIALGYVDADGAPVWEMDDDLRIAGEAAELELMEMARVHWDFDVLTFLATHRRRPARRRAR
jgi:hypothetical protein